ncbi:MAG: pyridoxal kinase [Pseudomonadota bacterium]
MARILAINSFVAHGHVGLSAMVPVLQGLGHDVMAVPTVVLSNHYGYDACGGFQVSAKQLETMLSGLMTNGWLDEIDAVVSGYMAETDQVELLAGGIEKLADSGREFLFICDPVLGDDPNGLYVPEDIAKGIRDDLLPMADIVTPNRFELAWLSGTDVTDAETADTAAEILDVDLVVATSIPAIDGRLASLISGADVAMQSVTAKHDGVPHGAGDLFAALFVGHVLNDCDDTEALARAAAGVDVVIGESLGGEELKLVPNLLRATKAEPLGLEDLSSD